MTIAVLSAPMSMRMGSGVKTMASTFSITIKSPSEEMKMLVRKEIDQEPRGGRREDGGGHRHNQRQVQELLPHVGVVRGQREDRAMGHVEVERRAVDQSPAEGAEGVEAAHHEPRGQELKNEVHGAGWLRAPTGWP